MDLSEAINEVMYMERPKVKVTKATTHNGRSHKGKSFNANHNTLECTRELQSHIDPTRFHENKYYKFEPNKKPVVIRGGNGGFDATKHEKKIYKQIYGDGLEARNERYLKSRHKEKCKEMKDLYYDPKTAPMETIFQIGNIHSDLDRYETQRKLEKAWVDTYNSFYRKKNIIPLDAALHMEEQSPHIHFRYTFAAQDKFGYMMPNQTAALREMGFTNDKTKAQSRYNNPLIDFTDQLRETFYENCEKLGLKIDREVINPSKRHLDKLEYKVQQLEKDKKELSEELLRVHSDVLSQREMVRNLETRKNEIGKELQETKKELEIVRKSLKLTQEENSKLKDDNSLLQQQNEEYKAKNKEMFENLEGIKAEVEKSTDELNLQRSQIKDKKEKLVSVEKLISAAEEHDREFFQTDHLVKPTIYGKKPAVPEKKNKKGKVVREARPETLEVSSAYINKLWDRANKLQRYEKINLRYEEYRKESQQEEYIKDLIRQIEELKKDRDKIANISYDTRKELDNALNFIGKKGMSEMYQRFGTRAPITPKHYFRTYIDNDDQEYDITLDRGHSRGYER